MQCQRVGHTYVDDVSLCARSVRPIPTSNPSTRMTTPHRLVCWLAVVCASGLITPQARGAFHLWKLQEIYTDSSGTLQFIEMFENLGGGEIFVGGMQIQVQNVGNTQTHTFNLPPGDLDGSTFNHALLFGTAGLQAAGGPAPDYIIPNDFLFPEGGTISFFGANSGPYSALPTNGSLSRTWTGGDALNSPQNFAGQSGTVSPPPPVVPGDFDQDNM